ncbi:uncharacterized protein LOC108706104 [Xenopus laevis]|uniref:Uncharacterized protein LOC108706104 n=1 Tax=Xenopus laevis TaxID=8355 RepID=A0A8J1LVA3_XENLA|nr:uncharacterized protein LOC108706104 [Xenopus laevis]
MAPKKLILLSEKEPEAQRTNMGKVIRHVLATSQCETDQVDITIKQQIIELGQLSGKITTDFLSVIHRLDLWLLRAQETGAYSSLCRSKSPQLLSRPQRPVQRISTGI